MTWLLTGRAGTMARPSPFSASNPARWLGSIRLMSQRSFETGGVTGFTHKSAPVEGGANGPRRGARAEGFIPLQSEGTQRVAGVDQDREDGWLGLGVARDGPVG